MSVPLSRLPELYAPVETIETPAILVDLDVMDRNMRRMEQLVVEHDVALRSHAKTHKIADIAHQQVALTNARGIMCQTLDECVHMARNGIEDIHLARMVVTRPKVERVVKLADEIDHFVISVDGPANFEPLQETANRRGVTVNVVLEIDVNVGRTGVAPNDALETARSIQAQPNLQFEGILGHDGLVKTTAETVEAYEEAIAETVGSLRGVVETLEADGIAVSEVKTGSSATAGYAVQHSDVTEINPGRYPFFDGLHVRYDPRVTVDDCAVSVLTTVISKPTTDRVVVDAGSKIISPIGDPKPISTASSAIRYRAASSEHGTVDVSEYDGTVEVGDQLEFIVPSVNHSINLVDSLIGVREERVEAIWEVQARGASK